LATHVAGIGPLLVRVGEPAAAAQVVAVRYSDAGEIIDYLVTGDGQAPAWLTADAIGWAL
jgi:hypothetical protein